MGSCVVLPMLTCALKTQVNESNIEVVYWNVCIVFNRCSCINRIVCTC